MSEHTSNTTTPQSGLTPEQQIQLETVRAERLKLEAELESARQSNRALEEKRESVLRGQAERDAFLQSKVRFHNEGDALALITKDPAFDVRYQDGRLTALVEGERVEFSQALQHWALQNPTSCDGRSLRYLRENTAGAIRCKADLKDVGEKVAYVEKHGLKAWEALPLTAPDMKGVPLSFAEYVQLGRADKMRLIDERGLEWVENLPRRA